MSFEIIVAKFQHNTVFLFKDLNKFTSKRCIVKSTSISAVRYRCLPLNYSKGGIGFSMNFEELCNVCFVYQCHRRKSMDIETTSTSASSTSSLCMETLCTNWFFIWQTLFLQKTKTEVKRRNINCTNLLLHVWGLNRFLRCNKNIDSYYLQTHRRSTYIGNSKFRSNIFYRGPFAFKG